MSNNKMQEITSPTQLPWGLLHNDADYMVRYQGKMWRTASHAVYSSILLPSDRLDIGSIDDIHLMKNQAISKYYETLTRIRYNAIQEACETLNITKLNNILKTETKFMIDDLTFKSVNQFIYYNYFMYLCPEQAYDILWSASSLEDEFERQQNKFLTKSIHNCLKDCIRYKIKTYSILSTLNGSLSSSIEFIDPFLSPIQDIINKSTNSIYQNLCMRSSVRFSRIVDMRQLIETNKKIKTWILENRIHFILRTLSVVIDLKKRRSIQQITSGGIIKFLELFHGKYMFDESVLVESAPKQWNRWIQYACIRVFGKNYRLELFKDNEILYSLWKIASFLMDQVNHLSNTRTFEDTIQYYKETVPTMFSNHQVYLSVREMVHKLYLFQMNYGKRPSLFSETELQIICDILKLDDEWIDDIINAFNTSDCDTLHIKVYEPDPSLRIVNERNENEQLYDIMKTGDKRIKVNKKFRDFIHMDLERLNQLYSSNQPNFHLLYVFVEFLFRNQNALSTSSRSILNYYS